MVSEPWRAAQRLQEQAEREKRENVGYDRLMEINQTQQQALQAASDRIKELEGAAPKGKRSKGRQTSEGSGRDQAVEGGGYAAVADMSYDGFVQICIWSWGAVAVSAFENLAILTWGLHAFFGFLFTGLYRWIRFGKKRK